MPDETYRTQHRGGRGVTGLTMREEDDVQHIVCLQHDGQPALLHQPGRCYALKAHEVPDASRTAKGTPIINLLSIQPDEVVTTPMAVKDFGGATLPGPGDAQGQHQAHATEPVRGRSRERPDRARYR